MCCRYSGSVKKKNLVPVCRKAANNAESRLHIFHPSAEKMLFARDLVTINTSDGLKTKRVNEWLSSDPVSFDMIRRDLNLKIHKEVFEILISKLRKYHPEYFKNALGLKVRINFKGYDKPVQAIVPYNDNPVDFYKWWSVNQDKVYLSTKDKIVLFNKVQLLCPSVLKNKDRKKLN